jgi:hypothetical protein
MKHGNVVMIVLLMVVGAGIAFGAYYFGRGQAVINLDKKKEVAAKPSSLQQEITYPTMSQLAPTIGATGGAEKKTIVTFEAEGAIPVSDKSQLQKKVVDPMVDYYKEANMGELVTLTISVNNQASKTTYPYLGLAVLGNGGNLGFTIEKKGDEIGWWYPECMMKCPLSQSYQTKYPEVAKIVGY